MINKINNKRLQGKNGKLFFGKQKNKFPQKCNSEFRTELEQLPSHLHFQRHHVCRWGQLTKMWLSVCALLVYTSSAHTDADGPQQKVNHVFCRGVTNGKVTEDNLTLSWSSIRGLPTSQDSFHWVKFVCSDIIAFIQPIWHDVFVNVKVMVFLISMRQVQSNLGRIKH